MAKDFARTILLVMALLLFVALGGIGFLIDQMFRSPGLKRKVRELENQVSSLEVQAERLEDSVDDLRNQNDRFTLLNVELNVTVAELALSNSDFARHIAQLNESNSHLNNLNAELHTQMETLKEHNKELTAIVDFLNSTSLELGQSVEKLTEFLDDGIQFYQASSLRSLELDYVILTRNWDCDFRYFFLGENFAVNENVAVGSDHYPEIRSYVEDRILDDLCLSISDWEKFMEAKMLVGPLESMTTNQLIRGIRVYTRQALEFYFPDGGDDNTGGPTWSDWSAADYKCMDLGLTYQWA